MKYLHGWSSKRGTAKHLYDDAWRLNTKSFPVALCDTIVRVTNAEASKEMKKQEVCDHCQNARRRLKAKAK